MKAATLAEARVLGIGGTEFRIERRYVRRIAGSYKLDFDFGGVVFAQRQLIAMDTEFQRIAERGALHELHPCPWNYAHVEEVLA